MINPNLKNYLVGSSFAYVIRQNVALFFLLIGSLYLVLCAMVSISYNSDSIVLNPGDGTSSTARDSLRLSPGITKVLQLNTTINTQDSLALYTLISSKPDTSLSKIALGILGVNITSIKSNMDNSYRLISQSITRYNNAVQDFREFQEAKILEIDSKVNSVDLPKKLFNNYKNDIGNWFNQEINQDVQSLEQIQKQISQSITTINFVSNSIVTNYPAFLEALSKIKDENFNQDNLYEYFSPQLVNYYYLSDIDYTRFNSSLGDIKIPPKRGTEWGVLGTSTSWLTTTQSVDLILIVGMFGFGFLGAAISSFVNAQENIKENKPIIENLSVVIIRGFSAAIVIFLATKAGIAIINNGSNEPNPYFLFFSCLIGAVYSERIWDWARSQLKSKYKTADEQEQGVPQQGNLQPPTPQV